MKKYIFITALLILDFTSQSQVLISLLLGDKLNSEGLEFGLEGGINWSNISGLGTDESLPAFNLGYYFDIRVKNQLNFYSGVLVIFNAGVKELNSNDLGFLQIDTYPEKGKYKQVIYKFMIPALAKYKFKNHFYVEAGPQFGLMHGAYVEFNSNEDDKKIRIRQNNKNQINRFDVGIVGGLGYKLLNGKGMTIGIKYYQGFVDVYKNKAGTKNSSLNLKVNIPVGAKKSE